MADKQNWYDDYPRLNSASFTWENSGNCLSLGPPYQVFYDGDMNTSHIAGVFGMDKEWRVLGYTEHIPYQAQGYESIGIMFEQAGTFEKVWWHYPKL